MATADITIIEQDTFGSQTIVIGTFELPGSAWTDTGIAPGTAKFGLKTVNFCIIEPVEITANMLTAVFAKYDRAGDLIFLYETASGTSQEMDSSDANPVANVTGLRFMAIGRL
jgi:hypothetical protein